MISRASRNFGVVAREAGEERSMKFEFELEPEAKAKLKVVGVGGAGGNAVNRMIESGFAGVDFIAVNTDAQALEQSMAPRRVQIGAKLTHGLGSGGDPDVGRQAIEEDKKLVAETFGGADMIFVAAGMGGGTGTGAGPVVAELAKKAGALVVGVVTKPFLFEGQRRMKQAEEGLQNLKATAATVIVIPNQRLLAVASRETPIRESFRIADEVLLRATKGVTDLITVPGLVNLDFADVRSIMAETGDAIMGTGVSAGENRAVEAAQQALSSPLLEDTSVAGAKGILVNVTGNSNLTLHEVSEAATVINDAIGVEANMIFGAVIDDEMDDQVSITVIATGIDGTRKRGSEKEDAGSRRGKRDWGPPTRQPELSAPAARACKREERAGLHASGRRRAGRRDLEIPTFLRRQMD